MATPPQSSVMLPQHQQPQLIGSPHMATALPPQPGLIALHQSPGQQQIGSITSYPNGSTGGGGGGSVFATPNVTSINSMTSMPVLMGQTQSHHPPTGSPMFVTTQPGSASAGPQYVVSPSAHSVVSPPQQAIVFQQQQQPQQQQPLYVQTPQGLMQVIQAYHPQQQQQQQMILTPNGTLQPLAPPQMVSQPQHHHVFAAQQQQQQQHPPPPMYQPPSPQHHQHQHHHHARPAPPPPPPPRSQQQQQQQQQQNLEQQQRAAAAAALANAKKGSPPNANVVVVKQRNKGIRCKNFAESGACPIPNCPYNHLSASHVEPVPPSICKFFRDACCLRDNCQFFHGKEADLQKLRASGAVRYCPCEYMRVEDPIISESALTGGAGGGQQHVTLTGSAVSNDPNASLTGAPAPPPLASGAVSNEAMRAAGSTVGAQGDEASSSQRQQQQQQQEPATEKASTTTFTAAALTNHSGAEEEVVGRNTATGTINNNSSLSDGARGASEELLLFGGVSMRNPSSAGPSSQGQQRGPKLVHPVDDLPQGIEGSGN